MNKMRRVWEIQEVARRPRLTQSQWNCGQCLKCVEAIDRRDDCNDEREKIQQVWSEDVQNVTILFARFMWNQYRKFFRLF